MARERMITRTVISTNYSVMVVNMESKSVESITVTIPSGDTMTDKAREKAIKILLPEGKTFVAITGGNHDRDFVWNDRTGIYQTC